MNAGRAAPHAAIQGWGDTPNGPHTETAAYSWALDACVFPVFSGGLS